jgi:hypothetical protein
MRIILLVVLEIAAVFGIPRGIYEARSALGIAPPAPAVRVAHLAKAAGTISATPTRLAKAGEVESALLFQVLPSPAGRTVAKLAPSPKVRRPVEETRANAAVASPARDDDYLPPWMRGTNAAKAVESGSSDIRVAVAVQKPQRAKHLRGRRHSERRDYAGNARHGRRSTAYPWGF